MSPDLSDGLMDVKGYTDGGASRFSVITGRGRTIVDSAESNDSVENKLVVMLEASVRGAPSPPLLPLGTRSVAIYSDNRMGPQHEEAIADSEAGGARVSYSDGRLI